MAWVRMRHYISGGRPDGSQWPGDGGLLECSEDEARDLIRAQMADHAEAPQPAAKPAVREPVKSVTVAAPPEEQPDALEEASVPASSDPKTAWIEYAVSQGADEAEAARMSKADLQSRYGGRL